MIIGSDVFATANATGKLPEISSAHEDGRQYLTVEVGKRGSGVRLALQLPSAAELTTEEGLHNAMEVEVLPVLENWRLADLWESPKQLASVEQQLQTYHALDSNDVSRALYAALEAKVNLTNDGCPMCSTTHVDRGSLAHKLHDVHCCSFCRC